MIKRVVSVVVCFFTLSLPLLAQQSDPFGDGLALTREQLRQTGEVDSLAALHHYRPDLFSVGDGSLLLHGLPALVLLNGRRFSISGDSTLLGRAALQALPVAFLRAVRVEPGVADPMTGSDATGGTVDLRFNRVSSGGEAGVFYGGSGGRDGREDFQSYLTGGIGTDRFNISAGAEYQRSSGSLSR